MVKIIVSKVAFMANMEAWASKYGGKSLFYLFILTNKHRIEAAAPGEANARYWQLLHLSLDDTCLTFLHCVATVVTRWLSFELDLARLNASPFL